MAAEIAAANASPQTFPNMLPRFTLAQLDDNGNYKSAYLEPRRRPEDVHRAGGPDAAPDVDGGAGDVPAALTERRRCGAALAGRRPRRGRRGQLRLHATRHHGGDRSHEDAHGRGWIDRKRTASDSDIAYDAFNVVPAGGTALLDEVVSDAACTHCHGVVQAHGSRRGVPLCITCHSPQTSDPETSRTVDFQVMIHKIHFGRDLPSVQQGRNYFIVGNSQNVHDYSEVAFPWHDGVQHCTVCHQGEDADNWRQKPSITACTSCHDNVKFAASEATQSCSALTPETAFQDCVHSGGPLTVANPDDVTSCATCHGVGAANEVDNYHHGD